VVALLACAAAPGAVGAQRCRLSDLRLVKGAQQGTAGHFHLAVDFVNRSSRTCRLRGFPGVSSVAGGGVRIGEPATWDHSVPAVTVVLHPGGRARADYAQTDPGVYDPSSCHPKTAVGLRVYPPGSTRAGYLAWSHPACDAHGLGDSSVRRVQPGP
jgi:hypothetical protein